LQDWPCFNSKILEQIKIILPIQINGKVRATMEVEKGLNEKEIREKVLALPQIKEKVGTSEIKNFIYVPDKIVNIVV